MSECEAKVPFAPGLLLICGADATETYLYRCACGHEITAGACPDHTPEPDQVGCYRCLKEGHDCPMTAERILS